MTGPQNGSRFVGKFLVTRVSIVSARTPQKFSMPLLFHGFAALQALVLHSLRTFMATHVLELFEKLRVATLHGRLPTSPGSLAHNRLSHSSGTVRNLSLKLPNTSENFKRCTNCSQTLAPFSHTSQTNLALSQNISRSTKLYKEYTKTY